MVCAIVLALVLVAPHQCAAEPLASAGGLDIGALMSQAKSSLDLSELDAVLLYDGCEIEVQVDGGLRTTFHQIAWISTELGIDEYADLRVPYSTETMSLEVHALRTWRDDRWWPHESAISPTAVVETTPSVLGHADDYLTIRQWWFVTRSVFRPASVFCTRSGTVLRSPSTAPRVAGICSRGR
jgi:hypothetical protein